MVMISYKDGYRYQTCKDVSFQTDIRPDSDIVTEYIELYTDGLMIIKAGYAWDGPSGPCRIIGDLLTLFGLKRLMKWYIRKILPGSLFHDGGYQLIRDGLLSMVWREEFDKLFKTINIICKMMWARIQWSFLAVRLVGKSSADPKNKKQILTAP